MHAVLPEGCEQKSCACNMPSDTHPGIGPRNNFQNKVTRDKIVRMRYVSAPGLLFSEETDRD